MKVWTWGEMREKIQEDLNLKDEAFITPSELLGYANDAVTDAESLVIPIYDKYFESEVNLELIDGQVVYDLPVDIYANKITHVQYNNGAHKYQIRRIRNLEEIAHVCPNDDYRYRIVNKTADGIKIYLYPASKENSTGNVTIYFLREAQEIIDDTSIVDIPEGNQYIIQHIKDACANKEMGTMYSAPPSPALERKEKNFISAISDMVPDEDNKIRPDFSFYHDFDNDIYYGGY